MKTIETIKPNSISNPTHDLALSVLEGLSSNPKSLPSKLFYDDKGSELFKKIMELEEYYPTSCEAEILTKYAERISNHLNPEFNLVELGCGDGAKTMILLDQFQEDKKDFQYTPLDISKAAVEFLVKNLDKKYGEKYSFNFKGLVADYFQGLNWLTENNTSQNLVLFLGSNIGNFNKAQTLRFLRHLWYSLNPGDFVLIGFDLKKDLDVLYDAYNDPKGVTKEFNFNVLDRINKVLGANFDRTNYQHQGLYNIQTGAMESYLVSQRTHKVMIKELGNLEFEFKPWEHIHMEFSYKYLESHITELAKSAGFEIQDSFIDSKGYFVDSLWKVVK